MSSEPGGALLKISVQEKWVASRREEGICILGNKNAQDKLDPVAEPESAEGRCKIEPEGSLSGFVFCAPLNTVSLEPRRTAGWSKHLGALPQAALLWASQNLTHRRKGAFSYFAAGPCLTLGLCLLWAGGSHIQWKDLGGPGEKWQMTWWLDKGADLFACTHVWRSGGLRDPIGTILQQ